MSPRLVQSSSSAARALALAWLTACGSGGSIDDAVEVEGGGQGGELLDAGGDVEAGGDGSAAADAGAIVDAVVDAGADAIVDAGEGADAGPSPPDEPDFASLPWETGPDVGFGVARKDSGNPRGDNVFVGYGGFGASLDDACAWVTALYESALVERGVRHVFCVQGPATVGYVGLEIGNSKVARAIVANVTERTRFVLVAGHSSGSFVAHELLRQLADPALGLDPGGVTADRVVYLNLDGGQAGLPASAVARLRRAYFVGALDQAIATASPNTQAMIASGSSYGADATYLQLDATGSGCAASAVWCVHMTPVVTRPHDPLRATVTSDYRDFAGRPVTTSWIDAVADEAGLTLP
jgi:hypothetical protein